MSTGQNLIISPKNHEYRPTPDELITLLKYLQGSYFFNTNVAYFNMIVKIKAEYSDTGEYVFPFHEEIRVETLDQLEILGGNDPRKNLDSCAVVIKKSKLNLWDLKKIGNQNVILNFYFIFYYSNQISYTTLKQFYDVPAIKSIINGFHEVINNKTELWIDVIPE
jgi:hypothetical protein